MSKWTGKETVSDKKVFFNVGFRSDVMNIIDNQVDLDGTNRRQVAENLINALIDDKVKAIVKQTNLPIQEVVDYLMDRATS